MRVDDLIQPDDAREELHILTERCSEYIDDSGGKPLLKNLPSEYGDFHKVKVRFRKKLPENSSDFTETFNEAFEQELHNLRQRAVFANGEVSFESADTDDLEPFYIFPIDGYRFMYSKEVENSSEDYQTVFDAIFEQFGSDKGNEVITDLLKFTYTSAKLEEGIDSGSEIIIYNIPYFYAVRASTVENYNSLLNILEDIE